jgi:hypothetical protein
VKAPDGMNLTNQLNFWMWHVVSASKKWSVAIERQHHDKMDEAWDIMREAETNYFKVLRKIKEKLDDG